MRDKIKNIAVIAVFLLVVFGLPVANLVLPDADVSVNERRMLRQVPNPQLSDFLDKRVYQEYEEYFLDQFVGRDAFRTIKAIAAYGLLRVRDNNGVYVVGRGLYKTEYPLDERAILRAADKFSVVSAKYLAGLNLYYSIIPDKNYFVAEQNGYPSLDYARLVELMTDNMPGMVYIDIFGDLAIEDYYLTDLHWRQEAILHVAEKILASMGSGYSALHNYTPNEMAPFYGAYYGQAALPARPETLVYLTSATTKAATVYVYEATGRREIQVYNPDLFSGIDPYNLFLAGPQMVVEIENHACDTGRELYMFRDSFGSSLAPLLLDNYSKITLIDLRYIDYNYLDMFITFTPGADAIFIYGTQILNNSGMLQ
ncbi:MAG: DHHW family protein [Dehalococcoidia bacterium]|nr:DHHW family protein [Dehalococcoidia bacterium]